MKIATKLRAPQVASELVPSGYVLIVNTETAKAANVCEINRANNEPGTPVFVDVANGFKTDVNADTTAWRITALLDSPVYYWVRRWDDLNMLVIDNNPPAVPNE